MCNRRIFVQMAVQGVDEGSGRQEMSSGFELCLRAVDFRFLIHLIPEFGAGSASEEEHIQNRTPGRYHEVRQSEIFDISFSHTYIYTEPQ